MSAEDLRSSLERLRASAAHMNSLSKSISDAFRVVEHFLVHDCSLGIEKWVPAGTVGATTLELGFCKVEGARWRLCIRPVQEPGTTLSARPKTLVAHPAFQTVIDAMSLSTTPNSALSVATQAETLESLKREYLKSPSAAEPPKTWEQHGREVRLCVVKALPDLVNALTSEVMHRISDAEGALQRIEHALPAKTEK